MSKPTPPSFSEPISLPYRDFVISKLVPPHPISYTEFHLLHATYGLLGEYLELTESMTIENTEEELGDMLFYFTALEYSLRFFDDDFELVADIRGKPLPLSLKALGAELEALANTVKKHVIYHSPQKDLNVRVLSAYTAYVLHILNCNMRIPVIQAMNKQKLDQRYAAKFTVHESETRKDKEGESSCED